MLEQVEKAVEESDKPLTVAESRRAALKAVATIYRNMSSLEKGPDVDDGLAASIASTYEEPIAAAKEYIFEHFPLPKGASKKLSALVLFVMTKDGFNGDSGVVIAGFGTNEVFPNLVEYEVDGVVLDHLVHWPSRAATVTADESAFVQGFAQSDVIHLFMEGVTGEYEEFVRVREPSDRGSTASVRPHSLRSRAPCATPRSRSWMGFGESSSNSAESSTSTRFSTWWRACRRTNSA